MILLDPPRPRESRRVARSDTRLPHPGHFR
jgi:hypothetical protein